MGCPVPSLLKAESGVVVEVLGHLVYVPVEDKIEHLILYVPFISVSTTMTWSISHFHKSPDYRISFYNF